MKQSIRDRRADTPNRLQKTASHSNPPTDAALAQVRQPPVAARALPFVLAVAAAQRRMRAATLQ
jgi:hypothetical protein